MKSFKFLFYLKIKKGNKFNILNVECTTIKIYNHCTNKFIYLVEQTQLFTKSLYQLVQNIQHRDLEVAEMK